MNFWNKFRMVYYTIIAIFFIVNLWPVRNIDPAITPFHNEIFSIIEKHCDRSQYYYPLQVEIKIQPLDKVFIAYCNRNLYTKFTIVYNSKHWSYQSDDQKFETLAHELLHCMFREDHVNDPGHFMFAYENNLSKVIVLKQLNDYLTKKCGK